MTTRLLPTDEAAASVFVSTRTLQTWVTRGLLAPVRPGRGPGRPALYAEQDVADTEAATRREDRWRQLLAVAAPTCR